LEVKLKREPLLHCPFCLKPVYNFKPAIRGWHYYCEICQLAVVPVEHLAKPKDPKAIGQVIAIPLKIEIKEVIGNVMV